jgi:hypothetical protein
MMIRIAMDLTQPALKHILGEALFSLHALTVLPAMVILTVMLM